MTAQEDTPGFYTQEAFEQRCAALASMVATYWQADLIVGLETGGAYVAAQLKTLLRVRHMVVLDVVNEDGNYRLGSTVRLNPDLVVGRHVLCVDDSFYRGGLLAELHDVVVSMGGLPLQAAIARIRGPRELQSSPNMVFVDELPCGAGGRPCHPNWPWKRLKPVV